MLQLGLEAHHVPQGTERIVLAELHHSIGPPAGARIAETHGLHRSEAQCVFAARRHHFDREAALEVGRGGFPLLELGFFAGQQRGDEGAILRLVERAVDVIGAVAFVVTRLHPRHRHVDALAIHHRRNRIEEGKRLFAGVRADRVREGGRGERSGGNDDRTPLLRGPVNLSPADLDSRMLFQRARDLLREAVAIHRQCATGRKPVRIAGAQDQRTGAPHLLMQEAHRIVLPIV